MTRLFVMFVLFAVVTTSSLVPISVLQAQETSDSGNDSEEQKNKADTEEEPDC